MTDFISYHAGTVTSPLTPPDYQTVHDAALAGQVLDDDSPRAGQEYAPGTPDVYSVLRGAIMFDTSSIPSGAIITAAVLSLYGYLDESDTDFDVVVVSGADLADIVVAEDYGDLLNDIASLGSFNTSTFQIGWNSITLNAAGIAAIVKGGMTRFGLRSSRDISSTTPKLNGALASEYVVVEGWSGDTNKPKLTITYTLGTLGVGGLNPALLELMNP